MGLFKKFKKIKKIFYHEKVLSEHIQYAIRRGDIKSRGVNLGSWLLAEHWMSGDSPIWNGVPIEIRNQGEYQTMQKLGHTIGDKRFEEHRRVWITEKDIQEIASYKLNTVRVPIGYWITGKDNFDYSGQQEWKVYAPGAVEYLDLLIKNWAKKYNIAVLVGIHAAKGSQNGMDHSAPPTPGTAYWSTYPENVKNSFEVVKWINERYRSEPAFLGIGLLNEPNDSINEEILLKYYREAIEYLQNDKVGPESPCIICVSPLLSKQSGPHMETFSKDPRIWQEWHKYLIWGYENLNEDQLLNDSLNNLKKQIIEWKGSPLYIGEWSVASPASAPFNDEIKFRAYVIRMLQIMDLAKGGWAYWTWKVSNDETNSTKRYPWSMRFLLRKGYIMVP